MLRAIGQYFLCICLTYFSPIASAIQDDPIRLFDKKSYSLNANMQVLKDETQKLTIDQVRSQEYNKLFTKSDSGVMNLGLSSHVYWIKVALLYPNTRPNTAQQKNWYLEIDKPLLNIAELYIPEENGIYEIQTADLRVPFSERRVSHVNSIYPLSFMLGEEKTLYIRIQSMSSLHFSLVLWTESAFSTKVGIQEFIYGLFFGSMIILLVYNFFLYRSLDDIVYFYYVAYLGGITIFTLLSIGHGFIHYEQFIPNLGKEYVAVVIWVSLWFGTMFFKRFLNTKKEHPRIDFFANLLLYISIVNAIIALFRPDHISIVWASASSFFYLSFLLFTSLYSWLKGNSTSRLLFFGWAFNAVGLIVYILLANKILPSNALTQATAPIGIVIEAVFLSFALGARIKRERNNLLIYDEETIRNLLGHESIFKNSLEGRYQMTLSGRIYNANTSLAKMFGLSTANDILKIGDDFTSQLFMNLREQYRKLISKGYTENNIQFINKDRSTLWAHHRAILVRSENCQDDYIEGTVIDLTELVQREKAIKHEEKERQDLEIASAESTAKSYFLSTMNHKIRSPLTAIIGYSEQLKESTGDKESKKICKDMIFTQSNELLQLINNILDISKIEANKYTIEKLPVTTLEIINNLKNKFAPEAARKNLRFSVDLTPPIPRKVVTDPTSIIQVLDNLCSNALRFTVNGSIRVATSWKEGQLIFSVIDTGRGVPAQVKPSLFEIFGDINSLNCLDNSGGLGLAISKRLVQLMGGDITLLESSNSGSTFIFQVDAPTPKPPSWLTQSEISQAELDNTEITISTVNDTLKPPPTPKEKKLSFSGTVLVAEDNAVNQKLIAKVLQKLGVKVVIVGDGQEACNYCDKNRPDLILMDINMPICGGLEATKYLRDKDYLTPVYALTAETDKEALQEALVAGCQGILSKPLRPKDIYSALQKHLPD